MLENEQIQSRDMIVEVDHPIVGKNVIAGIPIKMSLTPGSIYKAAPSLGADNSNVYQELAGLSVRQLDDLKKSGII